MGLTFSIRQSLSDNTLGEELLVWANTKQEVEDYAAEKFGNYHCEELDSGFYDKEDCNIIIDNGIIKSQ